MGICSLLNASSYWLTLFEWNDRNGLIEQSVVLIMNKMVLCNGSKQTHGKLGFFFYSFCFVNYEGKWSQMG